MQKRALVGGSGGSWGAYEAAVFAELGRNGEHFDAIYTSSASGFAAAYFGAGQPSKSEYVWRNLVTGSQLVNWTNRFRGREILDLEYLIDIFKGDPGRLDTEKLFASGVKIICAVSNAETGKVMYLTPSAQTIFQILIASAAVPLVHGQVRLPQGLCFDGGLIDPLPVIKAYEDGYREIVVVYNRSRDWQKDLGKNIMEKFAWFFPYPFPLLKIRRKKMQEIEEFLYAHSEIAVIRPDTKLPPRHTFDFNHERINAAADIGIADARKYLKR